MDKTEEEVKQAYDHVKESGMFWEFHPEYSGNWEEDKEDYFDFVEEYWDWNVTKN